MGTPPIPSLYPSLAPGPAGAESVQSTLNNLVTQHIMFQACKPGNPASNANLANPCEPGKLPSPSEPQFPL